MPGPSFLIGRAEECQMRPRSDRVSRRHARFFLARGADDGPRFRQQERHLRQRRAGQGERELKNGDRLKVGPLEFEVQLSVSVSGKKKPKVHNVQEAAARTVDRRPATSWT